MNPAHSLLSTALLSTASSAQPPQHSLARQVALVSQFCMRKKSLLLCFLGAFIIPIAGAQGSSATWNASPATNDWNTPANWSQNTVPNGPADVATFEFSHTTNVSLSASVEVNSMVFNSGASAFTFSSADSNTSISITGAGILNGSNSLQAFALASHAEGGQQFLIFNNGATAGDRSSFSIGGGVAANGAGAGVIFAGSSSAGSGIFSVGGGTSANSFAGTIVFLDKSTAADASFTASGATAKFADGATIDFGGTATADGASFSVNGGTVGHAGGGQVTFHETSAAGTGTFTASGVTTPGADSGLVAFFDQSSAGDATLIASGSGGGPGGVIEFDDVSEGGTARVELLGQGNLSFSNHAGPGLTIGSLEGDGVVSLDDLVLVVGSNGLSTEFSGLVEDIVGGALAKIGGGTLTLSGSNSYTGGTTITAGTLVVSNKTGSGTGTGAVTVNGGTLGGSGTLSGAVTVNSGAFLAPAAGTKKQATLTIQSAPDV